MKTKSHILTETKLRNIVRKEILEMLENMDASDFEEVRKVLASSTQKRNLLKTNNNSEKSTVVGFLGHGFR